MTFEAADPTTTDHRAEPASRPAAIVFDRDEAPDPPRAPSREAIEEWWASVAPAASDRAA